jgi:FMN reductase
MRPPFAHLRARPTDLRLRRPRGRGAAELGERIARAAGELSVLLRAGVCSEIPDRTRCARPHEFGGNATRAGRGAADVDSPLMRLAAGGSLDG